MWIQIDSQDSYERWVLSKSIEEVRRDTTDIKIRLGSGNVVTVVCDTEADAKGYLRKLLQSLAQVHSDDVQAVNFLTYEQEMKLKIADAAIEIREAILAKGEIGDIHLKYLAMYNLIDSLTEWRGERKEGE